MLFYIKKKTRNLPTIIHAMVINSAFPTERLPPLSPPLPPQILSIFFPFSNLIIKITAQPAEIPSRKGRFRLRPHTSHPNPDPNPNPNPNPNAGGKSGPLRAVAGGHRGCLG